MAKLLIDFISVSSNGGIGFITSIYIIDKKQHSPIYFCISMIPGGAIGGNLIDSFSYGVWVE